jgi:hypothetical protein
MCRVYLDVTALKQLNWSAATSLVDGIKKTWDFIQGLEF